MSAKPTLILIHGAWHTPTCWNKYVVPQLEAQGYKCVAEQILFSNTVEPLPSIKHAIEQVQGLIEAEVSQGRDVVVINHSFGGSVGQSAVNGYTSKNLSKLKEGWGKVIGICYVCAFMPPAETSLIDVLPPRDTLFHTPTPGGWEEITRKDPRDLFYHDCSKEDQDLMVSELKNLSTACLEGEPGRNGVYEGFMDVPVWYLFCTLDGAIVIQAQEMMVAAAKEKGASVTTRTLESSHSPFISKPKETAEFILDAAMAFQA
ncbi:alpha/beta-hydrolase [Rhizodiscina lignyota]|uniref:Alpha/beta-hydrolase n=1 Tax=Rhizodiscina lignyota TaxID=1504668 RepID=A0A9P4M728_9PEZI|nr:alpha/beta-hydrolase [Rhizodiscina lignyota]